MENKYVEYIEDEYLITCINNLYKAYEKAKEDINKKKFYKNKIDTFKLLFDSHFSGLNESAVLHSEILRQIDKSINNSIGTFHEEILGGIKGFELGKQSGFDIKACDDTLFADIKNKHNTMNSSASESLFQKLAKYADSYKKANCYWVQILAKNSFEENWVGEINGKEYSHSRVFKISGDRFYKLLTGRENALFELYQALPIALRDFLTDKSTNKSKTNNSAIGEIENQAGKNGRTVINEITFENYFYYLGFSEL